MNTTINHFVMQSIQVSADNAPIVIFLLGANGSGKSSLRAYLDLSNIQTNIDPDALNRIAMLKNKDNPLIFASKQAITLYKTALENSLNTCMESTFSGKSILNRIMRAKQQGYHTVCYFMGLECVELNIERVAHRVKKGGHDIATELIVKRYDESVANLINHHHLFDELHVIDNSLDYYRLQFSHYKDQVVQYDKILPWANGIYKQINQ
ncbi:MULTISPECIES: zeta toxin family protein [Cysteiniphilum]|uniref:zeta toxin family protein n=1 Tax=Cysteiniphilum TaxID=2056696 RepID=UPI00178648D2|nr:MULTISPECIES: zeta toxin family protein [Cysteiniphilum]